MDAHHARRFVCERLGCPFCFALLVSFKNLRTLSFSFSPILTIVSAFIFIARRLLDSFLPSPIRIELRLSTLLGALSSRFLTFYFFNSNQKSHPRGI